MLSNYAEGARDVQFDMGAQMLDLGVRKVCRVTSIDKIDSF